MISFVELGTTVRLKRDTTIYSNDTFEPIIIPTGTTGVVVRVLYILNDDKIMVGIKFSENTVVYTWKMFKDSCEYCNKEAAAAANNSDPLGEIIEVIPAVDV